MEDKERRETLERLYDRLQARIEAATGRVQTVLGFALAMCGALAAVAPRPTVAWTLTQGVFGFVSALGLVGGIVMAALATFPRTGGRKGSLIAFGGIAEQDGDRLKAVYKGLSEGEYEADLVAQVHYLATLAAAKFRWLQGSLVCVFCTAPFWTIAVYVCYRGM